MKFLVGCPVSDRSWILDHWFDHVYTNFHDINAEPSFIFVVPEWDQKSIDILNRRCDPKIIFSGEPERKDERSWSNDRIQHLVKIRNLLLDGVREEDPDFFLSVDSDILLAKDAMSRMMKLLQIHNDAWAVGSKCFLSAASYAHPNMGWFINNGKYRRENYDGIIRVDILMAIKLMTREAYNTSYSFHRNGEDLGWSENIKASGGTMYWDGSVTSKHIMKREMLDAVDRRVGF